LEELARIAERKRRIVPDDTDWGEEIWADSQVPAEAPSDDQPEHRLQTFLAATVDPPADFDTAPADQAHQQERNRIGMRRPFYVGASAGLIAIFAAYLIWPGHPALSLLARRADVAIVAETPAVATLSAPAITLNPAPVIVAPENVAGGAAL